MDTFYRRDIKKIFSTVRLRESPAVSQEERIIWFRVDLVTWFHHRPTLTEQIGVLVRAPQYRRYSTLVK